MEQVDLVLPTPVERIIRSAPLTVEANTYKTRGEPIPVTVNGVTDLWHSVKGGYGGGNGQRQAGQSVAYEILYNPQREHWLKITPPEAKVLPQYAGARRRLLDSIEISRAALFEAGLPALADEVQEAHVMIRGGSAEGFVSPHIGPSAEYVLRNPRAVENTPLKDVASKGFLARVYATGFKHAANLYLKHGYWTYDANPGNLLLHYDDTGLHVVLIDFSNSKQREINSVIPLAEHKSAHRNHPDGYDPVPRNLEVLFNNFQSPCRQHNIPFSRELEEVKTIFERRQP